MQPPVEPWIVNVYEIQLAAERMWDVMLVADAHDGHRYLFPNKPQGWQEPGIYTDARQRLYRVAGAKKRGIIRRVGGARPSR